MVLRVPDAFRRVDAKAAGIAARGDLPEHAGLQPEYALNNEMHQIVRQIAVEARRRVHDQRRRIGALDPHAVAALARSEEPTSALHSLMRISYAVFCLHKNSTKTT